jgi:5,10-methylenetetrahydromethanopterin reductase
VTIDFGINFMPTAPAREVGEWARAVERHGYAILGISDSQSICRDVYVTLALCAQATTRIRLGPRVITPVTRHPAVAASAAATIEELAPGRTMVGIGRATARHNTARWCRRIMSTLHPRSLAHGQAEYHRATARFTWSKARVPIFLAASGPKTLRLAGEIADGVVVRTGILPEIIRDSIAAVSMGAEEAGRDPDAVEMWWWPDANIAPSRREAIEEIKMSLASAGNHLTRFTTEGKHIPPDLLPRVRALGEQYTLGTTQPGVATPAHRGAGVDIWPTASPSPPAAECAGKIERR